MTLSQATIDAADYIGRPIRSTHPDSFRSGRWGKLLCLNMMNGRWCYVVGWDDEVCDHWVIDDPWAGYEFGQRQKGDDAK